MSTADFDMTQQLDVLFVGNPEWHEFQQVCEELDATTQLAYAGDADAAAKQLALGDAHADLIIVAQIRPGQVSPQQVHVLRQLAPLARIVGLFGSWCEGESRTGSPWPAIPRIYWHQWPIAGRRQIQRLAAQRESWWQLPPTASPDERFLIAPSDVYTSQQGPSSQQGLIVIASPRWESSEALADACRTAGYHSVWHRAEQPIRTHGAVAVIWDGSGLEPADEQQLQHLSSEYPHLPLVALLNYPRAETVARAQQCGVTAVLSKPILVDDLLEAVQASACVSV